MDRPSSSSDDDELFIRRGVVHLTNASCRVNNEDRYDEIICRWVVSDFQLDDLDEPTTLPKTHAAFQSAIGDPDVVGPDFLLTWKICKKMIAEN